MSHQRLARASYQAQTGQRHQRAAEVLGNVEAMTRAIEPDRRHLCPSHPISCDHYSGTCAFVNRSDLAPIALAAIAHAQFETIHPFADGNGRTGRALIYAVLRRRAEITPNEKPDRADERADRVTSARPRRRGEKPTVESQLLELSIVSFR